MAAGLVPLGGWILLTALIIFAAIFAGINLFLKGFLRGMTKESRCWVDAIQKIKAPNWQSLVEFNPDEETVTYAKMYAVSYGMALEAIKEEIAMNRLDALMEAKANGSLLEDING